MYECIYTHVLQRTVTITYDHNVHSDILEQAVYHDDLEYHTGQSCGFYPYVTKLKMQLEAFLYIYFLIASQRELSIVYQVQTFQQNDISSQRNLKRHQDLKCQHVYWKKYLWTIHIFHGVPYEQTLIYANAILSLQNSKNTISNIKSLTFLRT